MAMTISEKILAAHADCEQVQPGQLIEARVDVALANDVTAPIAIAEFEQLGIEQVFDRDRVVLVPDHFTPNKDINSAQQAKIVRDFSRRQQLTNYFESGRHTCTYGALGAFATGVGSTDLAAAMATGKAWFKVPESIKLVYHGTPGPWVEGKDLILYTIGKLGVDGALYQSMEMQGEAIEKLPMYGRFSMANMAIEAGAKNGIITPDDITLDYVRGRSKRDYHLFFSDPGAEYIYEMDIDVSRIKPQVAFPSLPENSRDVAAAVEQQIAVDQVVIGSCTNGRIEDLRLAAKVLKGKKVAPYVRLIVIPGTQAIYLQAIKEGLVELFVCRLPTAILSAAWDIPRAKCI